MNLMKIMTLVQSIIAEGENSELVQAAKLEVIKCINAEFNCGYDRAEIVCFNIINNLTVLAKEKEII